MGPDDILADAKVSLNPLSETCVHRGLEWDSWGYRLEPWSVQPAPGWPISHPVFFTQGPLRTGRKPRAGGSSFKT